jgi:hypothetical protein
MRAYLVSSESQEGGTVVLQVAGLMLRAMDCLGHGTAAYPQICSELEVEFSCLHAEGESWESIFSGNPESLQCLLSTGGWSYRAFGRITSISPEVLVDCGEVHLPAPVSTSDSRCIGAFIAFNVARLDAWSNRAA